MPQYTLLTHDDQILLGADREISESMPKIDTLNMHLGNADAKLPVFKSTDLNTVSNMIPDKFKPYVKAVTVEHAQSALSKVAYASGLSSKEDWRDAPDAVKTIRQELLDEGRDNAYMISKFRFRVYNETGITLAPEVAHRAIAMPNLPFKIPQEPWGKGLLDAPPAAQAKKLSDFFIAHGHHPAGQQRFKSRLDTLVKSNNRQERVALVGYLHHYVGQTDKNNNVDKLHALLSDKGSALLAPWASEVIGLANDAGDNHARQKEAVHALLDGLDTLAQSGSNLDPLASVSSVMYHAGDEAAGWLAHRGEMADHTPTPQERPRLQR
jgi:hypothetical protein